MDDEQLEQALRRYQPRRPHSMLASRVLAGRATGRVPLRTVDWGLAVAAATLALIALWPHTHGAQSDPVADVYRAHVSQVARDLGGDTVAQELAAIIVAAQPASSDDHADEREGIETW